MLIRRNRFRRRTFRRRKFQSRRIRSRRIFRRFIRRRAVRPELKFALTSNGINVSANSVFTARCTPQTIIPGAGNGNRIGQKVNFIKVDLNFIAFDNSNTTLPLVAPSLHSATHRLLIWSPRIDIAEAISYFDAQGPLSFLDPNVATIHRDILFKLSPSYMAEASSNDISAATRDKDYTRRLRIKFPRKVHFRTDNVDEEKYSLYYTVITGPLATTITMRGRTWYFDA